MTHICVSELGQHWFRYWLVAWSVPSHYLNQCSLLSIGPLRTNFSEIQIKILCLSFKKMHLKFPSVKWRPFCRGGDELTHWGRVTHICVGNLTIIVSDNGLSPYRRQAIIWTNAGILLTGPLGTSFSEILVEILTFSFKKMRLKVSFAKRRPFCLGLNVLIDFNCEITTS